MAPPEDFTKIESVFVRHKNALVLRGQFTPLYTDYYLHLMQHGIRHAADLDQMLKDSLAMLVLHLVARPWSETIAWTVNLRSPRVNLFVTGGSVQESITGRIFTEDIREPNHNLFYSQTTSPKLTEPHVSTMEASGIDPLAWLAQFYDLSEQRPARAFRLDDENFALVTAQPDCDMTWFETLDANAISNIETTQETKLLETRRFHFHCPCTLEKILPILGGWKNRLDELFGNEDLILLQCPRCAAKYPVSRNMIH
jgi:molecular chaperone Hsp33